MNSIRVCEKAEKNISAEATAEHTILAIGTVLHVDEEGYPVSESGCEKTTAAWSAPVEYIQKAYSEHLGDRLQSLYIRGSVSRGNAIEGASDIDGLVVVYGDPKDIDWSWTTEFAKATA